VFRNRMPHYEILSADALATLDRGWKRIVSEIGVEFLSPWALDLLRDAGQEVTGDNVKFDPDWILAQVAKAPREFDLRARNPLRSVHIGGDAMVFGGVYGPPFVRQGATRRDATYEDFKNFCKLAQSFDALDTVGGVVCEPNDLSLDSRHLDMAYAAATLTDKFFMGNVVTAENARDVIRMAEIIHGGRDVIEAVPALISLINCNSPLRWDDRMLDSMREYVLASWAR
jgi:trimethylamine--corrinoid protein Co-methyltransferase